MGDYRVHTRKSIFMASVAFRAKRDPSTQNLLSEVLSMRKGLGHSVVLHQRRFYGSGYVPGCKRGSCCREFPKRGLVQPVHAPPLPRKCRKRIDDINFHTAKHYQVTIGWRDDAMQAPGHGIVCRARALCHSCFYSKIPTTGEFPSRSTMLASALALRFDTI